MSKEDNLKQSNQKPDFRLYAGLLVVLLASMWTREVTRPFYGLHSWAQASGAWVARSHVKYGLSYTKGMAIWAIGDPGARTRDNKFLRAGMTSYLIFDLRSKVSGQQ